MENKTRDASATQGNNTNKTPLGIDKYESRNAVKDFQKSNNLLSSTEAKAGNRVILKENFRKKPFKMKDLDLLNFKNQPDEAEEYNKHINSILNENIYVKTDPSNMDRFSIDTRQNTIKTFSKNKSKKNLNFVTKEKKLVNIIQLQDQIYSTNIEDFNNTTFHTMPSQISLYSGEAVKNSKLKSMKNYNKNMDYYQYLSEINKKHKLNAEFNMKKQYEFLVKQPSNNLEKDFRNFEEASKHNISHLLRMNPKNKLDEEVNDGKSIAYAEMIDNYKLYDRQEGEKIEEYVHKNSLLKRNKKMINFEKAQSGGEEKKLMDDNAIENKLRLEHKKPKDYLLMLSKKQESSNVFNNDNAEGTYRTIPSLNSNKIEKYQKPNFEMKHNFDPNCNIREITEQEINVAEDLQLDRDKSTIFHKNAQIEIKYKLDKQRKEIQSLFDTNKKTNLKTEADPAQDYKNIYFNMNRTLLNKKDLKLDKEKGNSFEKFKEYLNKKDRYDANKKVNNNNENYKIRAESNTNVQLPVLNKKKTFSHKKESSNKSNIDLVNCDEKPKSSKEKFEGFDDNENKNSFLDQTNINNNHNYTQDKKASYSQKNILEIDSFKLDNQNPTCFENNLTTTNKKCRYINPINNNIHSLADIEILDKKSLMTKLIKPFTPDILTNRLNPSQNKFKSGFKNKEDWEKNLNEKELKSEIGNRCLKNLSRINTLKTDHVSNYFQETCPTEITYNDTISSVEKSNLKSIRTEKLNKIKKLEEKINMGKIKKLGQIKNEISVGFFNMVSLEEGIKNRVCDSTQNFRNKLNKLQEKHYSTYMHEWQNAKHSEN